MNLKDIRNKEITKSKFDWMLACNQQQGTDFKVLEDRGYYFNITGMNNEQLLDLINSIPKLSMTKTTKGKTRIHTVNHPFYSKMNQFEEGKQTLVLGLAVAALESCENYRVFIGNNKKVYYRINTSEALRLGNEYNSIWVNPSGKKVAIIPLSDFKKIERKKKVISLPVEVGV